MTRFRWFECELDVELAEPFFELATWWPLVRFAAVTGCMGGSNMCKLSSPFSALLSCELPLANFTITVELLHGLGAIDLSVYVTRSVVSLEVTIQYPCRSKRSITAVTSSEHSQWRHISFGSGEMVRALRVASIRSMALSAAVPKCIKVGSS